MSTDSADAPDSQFRLSHDPWGRLVLTNARGESHVGVEPIRAFPLSDASHWVALVDAHGRELVLLEDMASLSADTRRLIEEELARREFVPEITSITRIAGEVPTCQWTVETDRGPAEFVLTEDDRVRRLGPNRMLILDGRGLRYLIPDITRLNVSSRRWLEPFR